MKKITFGVDIGGINSVIGVVDEEGNIFGEATVSTKAHPAYADYPRYIESVSEAMKGLLAALDFEYELVGIGIGAPNANYLSGKIEQPANLWKFTLDDPNADEELRIFPILEDLKVHFPDVKYTAITNDANAATIGEMVFGNARGMRDFAMITLGTGLGSGFVANGEMIYGHDGFAGEYGHAIVERGGRQCGCGRKGCLETYVSATGIKRTAFELMATMREPSPLRDIPFSKLESLDIAKAAAKGDALALEAFRFTGEMLGRALADVVTVTSPEAIILFGGLAKSGALIFEPTQKYMEENMLFAYKGKVKLLPSGIQDKNVAILGAAALIWQK
ncbi:MAG: ROK family protein [Rikenellaceae bacterium]